MFGTKPAKPNRAPYDEFHSWWHQFEMGAFRTTVVAVGVIALLAAALVAVLWSNHEKDLLNRQLAKERVMLGFQDERGVFVSSAVLPERIIVRFARGFVANFYNFSPYAVVENLEEARKLMSPVTANDYVKFFDDTIATVKRDNITQRYEIKDFKPPMATTQGYIVQFRGTLAQYVGQTPIGAPKETVVTVHLEKVEHSKTTPEGLVVAGVTDKPPEKAAMAADRVAQTTR